MARPLRIEYPGAYYHVTSRGNERKAIFRGDADREKFLELLGRAVEEFHLRLHGYVLMSNHYHLLVETPKSGLNRALRYLNGVYTQTFNRRHRRVGHLFQGRYKAILVDKDSYLLELSRYIHLNPWRLKKSEDPFKYRWSSLNAYVGAVAIPRWLTGAEVLSEFGSRGKRGYREFIVDGMTTGIKTPWEEVRGQVVMGSEQFVEKVADRHVRDRGAKWGEESRVGEIVGVKVGAVIREVEKYYGIKSEESPEQRTWIHGAPVCGELSVAAVLPDGSTGNWRAGRTALQCGGKCNSTAKRQTDRISSKVIEKLERQI
jgi:REP-associated tyrosine transposase